MICEGAQTKIEPVTQDKNKNDHKICKKRVKLPRKERPDSESFKTPKNWKKTISNFFHNPLRSSKSNEGDRPGSSNEDFSKEFINPEQKWQSLGKIFRRPSNIDQWNKNIQQGECSSRGKRLGIKKALSGYFVKSPKFEENSKSVVDNNDS